MQPEDNAESVLLRYTLSATIVAAFFGVGAGVFYAIHEYVVMVIFLGIIAISWLSMRHQIRANRRV